VLQPYLNLARDCWFEAVALAAAPGPLPQGALSRFAARFGVAMRPHFCTLAGMAALAGVAAAPGLPTWRVALAVGLCAGGWGAGQVFNDLLDREVDLRLAPDRPIARGELPALATLLADIALAGALVVAALALGWRAALVAVGVAAAGVGYNLTKALPGLGNLTHAAMVGACALLAPAASPAAAAGPSLAVAGVLAVADLHYVTANYLRDAAGDAAAGYRTLAVVLGRRAVGLAPLSSLALGAALAALHAPAACWAGLALSLGSDALLLIGAEPERAYRWATRALAAVALGEWIGNGGSWAVAGGAWLTLETLLQRVEVS
jgi:geranylgeranylglycerol-phosphate geranylgeranyltransferase